MKSKHRYKRRPIFRGVLFFCYLLPTFIFAAAENELPQDNLQTSTDSEQLEINPAEETDSKVEEAANDEQLIAALAKRTQINALIEEIDSTQGVYDLSLSQAHQDLGATLQTLNLHDEAVESYSIALQAERINKGLNNIDQLPILTKLIVSNLAMSDWEAADTNTQLYYHISKSNYAPGDERRVQAFIYLARWKLYAAKQGYLSSLSATEAVELYQNEIRLHKSLEEYEGKDLDLATLYLDHAQAEFYLAELIMEKPLKEYQQGADRNTVSRIQCFPVRDREGNIVQVCERIEEPNINYYINPSNEKKREVGRHLSKMQDGVMAAYVLLQSETINPEMRNNLMNQVFSLTNDYNRFLRENTSQ